MEPVKWKGEDLAAWTAFAAGRAAAYNPEGCAAFADAMMAERERRIDPYPHGDREPAQG